MSFRDRVIDIPGKPRNRGIYKETAM